MKKNIIISVWFFLLTLPLLNAINEFKYAPRALATSAYYDKMNARSSAMDGIGFDIIMLGYDIPGFAKQGELIWYTAILNMTDNIYCGYFFIHPKTKKVYFLQGLWNRKNIYARRNWKRKGLRIKDTQSTIKRARILAKNAFEKKTRKRFNGNIMVRKKMLGWKILGFINATDEIWEATFTSMDDKYLGLVWIHPVTEDIQYVTGPWIREE